MIKKIYTPSYTSNDDVSKISKIHFKNGEKVKSGKTLFTLENSKTSFDLEADEDGFYYTKNLVLLHYTKNLILLHLLATEFSCLQLAYNYMKAFQSNYLSLTLIILIH